MDVEQATNDGAIGRQVQLYRHRVLSRFEAGRTAAEIALDLEIPLRAVQHVLADHTGEPGPNDPTPEEIAERCRQIRSGEVTVVSGYRGGRPTLRNDGTLRTRATRVAGLRGLE